MLLFVDIDSSLEKSDLQDLFSAINERGLDWALVTSKSWAEIKPILPLLGTRPDTYLILDGGCRIMMGNGVLYRSYTIGVEIISRLADVFGKAEMVALFLEKGRPIVYTNQSSLREARKRYPEASRIVSSFEALWNQAVDRCCIKITVWCNDLVVPKGISYSRQEDGSLVITAGSTKETAINEVLRVKKAVRSICIKTETGSVLAALEDL